MRKNLIVIDTNVLISSLIGQHGYSHKIFDELVLTLEVKICLSREILEEYHEVANRPRFAKYLNFTMTANKLIKRLEKIAVYVEPTERINVLPDEDDNKFLEAAVEAGAGCVVTGNTNDFTVQEFMGVKIYTPKEFYEIWALAE